MPDDKRETLAMLRESILKSEMVDVKTIQSFASKYISIELNVPGANLFCREAYAAISRALKGKNVSLSYL